MPISPENRAPPDNATARREIANPTAAFHRLRAAARQLFEAGDFAAATTGFARAFAAGDDDPDTIAALHDLYTDAGNLAAVAALVSDYVDRAGDDLDALSRVTWEAARFDAIAVTDPSEESRADAALRLLEAAAVTGVDGWPFVLDVERWQSIEAAFSAPLATLDLLEQQSYAPQESALPTLAVARAEEIGYRYADDPTVARAAERLLHAIGERDAAYRVEHARRRAAQGRSIDAKTGPEPDRAERRLDGLIVVIAGGHPALRTLIRHDLGASGVTVREVPPAWEARRHTRDVRERLTRVDLAVLISRQIAHSTADQVRTVADRLGVPVVSAASASAAAVRRAVASHVEGGT